MEFRLPSCCKWLLLCGFFCVFIFAKAQNADSLRSALAGATGKARVDILTDLSFAESQSLPDSAHIHAEEAAQLAKEINYTSGLASALHKMAVIYRFQGYYDKALQYGDSALTILGDADEPFVRAGILANNGVSHRSKGQFEAALRDSQRAIDLYTKLGAKSELGTVLNNVGVLYMYMEDYPKAREYYGRALEIQKVAANPKEKANILNNFAIVYANEGELDSALTYFQKSLAIEESLGNKKGMSECINNIGAVYYYMGNVEQAIVEVRKSYAIDSTLGDVRGQIACMNNIAEFLTENGKADEALKIFEENLIRAKTLDSYSDVEDAYRNLADAYKEKGDYKKSYMMLSEYVAVHDSALGNARQKAIAEMETRFETREKEQKIKIQKLEIQEKEASLDARQNLILGLSIVLLLLVVATIFAYRAYKSRKAVELQTALSREQTKRLDAVIDATENERKRLAKELHDGIGQQLSSIKLGLSNFFNALTSSTEMETERIGKIQKVVDESARDVRNLSHQMMPKALTEVGLAPALQDLFDKSLGLVGLDFQFDAVAGKKRLPEKVEINLYRIAQELVNNCIKHSGATRVDIELVETPRRVTFHFEDNGKGFNPAEMEGHGMLNMKSRVNHVNGSVEFLHLPKGGMRTEIDIPLV